MHLYKKFGFIKLKEIRLKILGNIPHHSMENNFTIKGSLKIEGVRENLQWKDAQVTREYDVIVKDENDNPAKCKIWKLADTHSGF